MPALRSYRVFISHCWEYNRDYHRLVEFLSEAPLFHWQNHSVPEGNALREDKKLEYRLRKRVGESDILLVVVGMEVPRRHWVRWELKWARIRGTPVVGVRPRGMVSVPKAISRIAKDVVGWRRESILRAIRKHALDRP
ncbi:MAG: TIR domain-containing protein [Planctomycetota bacterium]